VKDWNERADAYEAMAENTMQTAEIIRRYDTDAARRLEKEAGNMKACAEMVRGWALEELNRPTMGYR